MSLEWYLTWYNLIFVAPFLAALLYLGTYAVSGLTFGETDTEASGEAEADAHVEAGAEAHAEVHAEVHAEADGDHDAGDHDAGHHEAGSEGGKLVPGGGTDHTHLQAGGGLAHVEVPLYRRALRALGVGRVPLSIVLMVFCFLWGFFGVATNWVLHEVPLLGDIPWLVSVPAAFLGGTFLTGQFSSTLGRWMPSTETRVEGKAALVGRPGVALFHIDQTFGMAVVRDLRGNSHQVPCRTYPDGAAINQGATVLLVDYDAEGKFYRVIVSDVNI
jgi:hypothetical protein